MRDKRKIANLTTNDKKSIREIQKEYFSDVSSSTIFNVLSNNTDIIYKKFKRRPLLNLEHKKIRLEFALNHMLWCSHWRNVVFSDEKRFNLDGPDGYTCHWHDLRKEEDIFSKRQNGNLFNIYCMFN